MTEAEKIALALLNEVADQYGMMEYTRIDRKAIPLEALCRAIEAHEAFKRDVSEALVWYFGSKEGCTTEALRDFILKPPVDPLIETLCAAITDNGSGDFVDHATMQKALAARGLQITEIGQ